jgi:putative membrane protein
MRRLHPLTGLLRTAQYGVYGLGVPVFVLGALLGIVGAEVDAGLIIRAMAVGGIVGSGYGLASYLRYRYALQAETLVVTEGVLARREREVPVERVQNVDVHRELLHRVLGLAVVRIETAGGTGSEAELDFVSAGEAERLQEVVRRRRAELAEGRTSPGGEATADSDAAATTEPSPEATAADGETTTLFSLTPRDLLVYSLTEIRPGAFALSLLGVPLADRLVADLLVTLARPLGGPERLSLAMTVDEALAVALVALPLVLVGGLALGAALGVLGYWGFKLGRRGSDLVYERGLTTKYSGAIPLSKIQTLTVTSWLFQRPLGYAGLRVETAGLGSQRAQQEGSPSAIPLAARDRVWSFAAAIEGCEEAPDVRRPPERARRVYAVRYLLALGALTSLGLAYDAAVGTFARWWAPALLVPLVPLAAHLKWANRGYALGEDHLFVRRGFWRRRTSVVPYRRLQTVVRSRTVFQRRLGLADLVADTASSFALVGGGAVAHDLPAETAADLRNRLREELQASLGTAPPDSEGTAAVTESTGS